MHFPLKFLQKPSPPTFSMVHLVHRLYGVDAPGVRSPVVDEERMRPGHWLGLVLVFP